MKNYGIYNNGDSNYFRDSAGSVYRMDGDSKVTKMGTDQPLKLSDNMDSDVYSKNDLAPLQATIHEDGTIEI